MIIRLKSVAANYNYQTFKLKDYYEILKTKLKVRLVNAKLQEIDPWKVTEHSFIEIETENNLNILNKISYFLGYSLLFMHDESVQDNLTFFVKDDFLD